jgi:SAM-dependent methyltransferase
MHNNSLELFVRHGLPLIKVGDRVLEVGPDWAIPGGRVRPHILRAGASYSFTDIDPKNKYSHEYLSMFDEYSIDVDTNSFDVVVTLSVIEHVRQIWTWVGELVRVTRPGGLNIYVSPVSWPFHESPVDCWRILPEGYKALFQATGLEHVSSWTGNVSPLEDYLRAEHGPHQVTDTIAIGRKPCEYSPAGTVTTPT